MALFEVNPFDFQKISSAARDALTKRVMKDTRPEAEPRKGLYRFINQMTNKKQQRLFTLNADTIKRLANTDPITWAIRRTIKGYVNQAEWDIVIDTEAIEQEIDRFEEYAISHLSPYASGTLSDFKSDCLESKLLKKLSAETKRVLNEPFDSSEKKKALKWYFASVIRQIRQEAEGHKHEVKQLFERPSERGIESTFRTLQELVVDDLLVFDSGVIVKNYSRAGDLAELYHLPGDQIRLYRNEDRTIPDPPEPAYVWEEDGVVRAEYTRDELIYMMQNPQSNGYGMSPLEVAAYVITAGIYADEYNIDFFKNSNVPPGVFDLGKDVTEDQRTMFQGMWENEVRGRGGLHRMLFTSGADGAKFIPIQTQSNKESQMMEYMKWTLSIKTAVYGLSGQDIGFITEFHRTTAETQSAMSQARGVRTILTLLEQYYNKEIVQKEFEFDDIKFEWQDIDSTNEEKESMIDSADLQHGVISINERRKKIGMKPIDGGDTPTIATPQVLAVSDLEEKEAGKKELEEQTGEEGLPSEEAGEEKAPEEKSPEAESSEDEDSPLMNSPFDEKAEKSGDVNFTVNRKVPVEKQYEKMDTAIKTLKDQGVDATVKVSFEVPDEDMEK